MFEKMNQLFHQWETKEISSDAAMYAVAEVLEPQFEAAIAEIEEWNRITGEYLNQIDKLKDMGVAEMLALRFIEQKGLSTEYQDFARQTANNIGEMSVRQKRKLFKRGKRI